MRVIDAVRETIADVSSVSLRQSEWFAGLGLELHCHTIGSLSKLGQRQQREEPGKNVSIFLTFLPLCLFVTWLKLLPFLPKFYCFIVSNYGRATVAISQNDVHVLTTTWKWAIEVAREARRPRDHVNFAYSRAPFVGCNLFHCLIDVAVLISRPGA